jgi:hypothetical protein
MPPEPYVSLLFTAISYMFESEIALDASHDVSEKPKTTHRGAMSCRRMGRLRGVILETSLT